MTKRVGMLGAAFGAAALAGLAFYVKRSFTAIDATAKLADTIGLTTEQLVGYQQAAAISGASTKDLTTAFRRMLKNVSDAGLGLTTAQRAFEALGLNADELKSLKTDEIFKRIADQINKIPTAADRARVAQDLFGRSGLAILKITEQGAEGIKRFQAEAQRLGISFSRVDAAKIEAANDAMQRAGSVLKGVVNTLAIKLAPFIEASAIKFRELAAETDAFGTIVADTFTTAISWIKIGSTAVTRFMQGFNILGAIASGAGLAVVGTLNMIGLGLMKIVQLNINFYTALGKGFKTIASIWNVQWKGMKVPFVAFLEFTGTKFSTFLSEIGIAVANLAPGISKTLLNASDSILRGVQGITGKATGEFTGALDELKQNAEDTGAAFTGMFDNIPTKGPLHDQMVGLAERTADLVNNIKLLEKENSQFIGGLDDTIADIEARSKKIAAIANAGGGSDGAAGAQKEAEKRRQADFKQVSLSRFVLNSQAGSTVKKQKVEAPEFKQMVQLLQQIATADGGAVAQ